MTVAGADDDTQHASGALLGEPYPEQGQLSSVLGWCLTQEHGTAGLGQDEARGVWAPLST